MLDDLHGQPSTQLISPRACMRSEESLFSPINMQIVPSPPPSDVFVFGNTPRFGCCFVWHLQLFSHERQQEFSRTCFFCENIVQVLFQTSGQFCILFFR